jgi:hypothetical protein
MRSISFIAIALLTFIGYGASIADADVALCFGRDGHAAVEGSSEHESAVPSAAGVFTPLLDHGPCVDVVMQARDRDPIPDAVPPAAATLTPVIVHRAQPPTAARYDGHPLLPPAGFGSTLLRI